MRENEHGQPVGAPIEGWQPRERPAPDVLEGRVVRLEPLAATHAEPLFEALCAPEDNALWTYRSDEPPESVEEMARKVAALASSSDQTTYAVVPLETGRATGMLSLLRDDPAHGVIELGAVIHARATQRTLVTTEAAYLVMRHVFDDLGYRRLEWKLDRLNTPSAAAARRLGFVEEGTFRQHQVVKGRNRDTQWFALTDTDWPAVRGRLEAWLDVANFDADGRQRRPLGSTD